MDALDARIDTVNQLACALRQLSSAFDLGALSRPEVEAVIAHVDQGRFTAQDAADAGDLIRAEGGCLGILRESPDPDLKTETTHARVPQAVLPSLARGGATWPSRLG